jgi:hypothetical protein
VVDLDRDATSGASMLERWNREQEHDAATGTVRDVSGFPVGDVPPPLPRRDVTDHEDRG